jgi:hypothetical protein
MYLTTKHDPRRNQNPLMAAMSCPPPPQTVTTGPKTTTTTALLVALAVDADLSVAH